jgi:predicted outer membrane repeat protein
MRAFILIFLTLALATLACRTATSPFAPDIPVVPYYPYGFTPPPDSAQFTPTPTSESLVDATPSLASVLPTATDATPAQGVIRVTTLEQEVHPFVKNGKCSLGEAIHAANSGQPVDTCAAGVPGSSVIELPQGEYRFTQRDQTPQPDGAGSMGSVGNALPAIAASLVIHGRGATLLRDQGAEPFRFFELLSGTLTLDDLTLKGGNAVDDWGGAIYAMNASLTMENVHLVGNRGGSGGALYLNLGRLTILNSEFTDNHSLGNGGGVFIDSARADIESTRFEGNTSDGNGGGLFAETVTLRADRVLFIGNRVTGGDYGTMGGGMFVRHVNLQVTRSQFYRNESPTYGGAISIVNPVLMDAATEEGDPLDDLDQNPTVVDMMTSIPGFQATLEAHPSGIFQGFREDAQIHDSCFANNVTYLPDDPNWSSGIVGLSEADGNYWGDSSGPSGMGPGIGDSVGRRIVFAPYLTSAPTFCDVALAARKQ